MVLRRGVNMATSSAGEVVGLRRLLERTELTTFNYRFYSILIHPSE